MKQSVLATDNVTIKSQLATLTNTLEQLEDSLDDLKTVLDDILQPLPAFADGCIAGRDSSLPKSPLVAQLISLTDNAEGMLSKTRSIINRVNL